MATARRLRAFKRWMKANGVECSEVLRLVDNPKDGVSVRTLCDLKEGDVVATIPKTACLTIKTSGACEIIESAGLDGTLGLSVAVMYERSLGQESPWSGYLQLLPHQEDLPLVWSLHELDSLLLGTELHKVVKEDKDLVYEDWKENIFPIMDSSSRIIDPNFFGVEEYFAAKTLIASRSFQIDEYHGSGMVPLADLFNHRTGAEDVHFTTGATHDESDNEAANDDGSLDEDLSEDETAPQSSSPAEDLNEISDEITDEDSSMVLESDQSVLEMIMVKDVSAGSEVFNTYGMLGNAALLHRYGFTEPENRFDIVNIDMEIVFEWASCRFSNRYARARLALWRKLGYAEDSEYFEVSSDGEPQSELLILLYIFLLPENTYNALDIAASSAISAEGFVHVITAGKDEITFGQAASGSIKNRVLLTEHVCEAVLAIVDKRECLYGSKSLEDDIELLKMCCLPRDRRLCHSLTLRVSERKILEKLRNNIRQRVDEISGQKPPKKSRVV